ncbi:MAG: nitrate reductase [Pseudohongiella sp.]
MNKRTTCPYCGVGCGLIADPTDTQEHIAKLTGDQQHPANRGRLCVKGSSLHETLGMETRLLKPQLYGNEVDWEQALDEVAERLQRCIREHGPDSVAFYVSGQLLTEDYYVANKLIKGFLGTANIDTNSRLCMSTAVAAHKRVLGSDTVPGCYQDLELADLLIITGSNMAWTHPVIYQRIAAAKQARPEMRIVVIDPRRTATADIADLHLDLAPGSDASLFTGLFSHLLASDALDHSFIDKHTEGFEDAQHRSRAAAMDLATTAQRCQLDREKLQTFYDWFTQTEKTVTVFSQGINQSINGVSQASTILHCHLATGRIGKPGACPFSITGQPNAMGGREVGGLANQLAAHMDIENPAHRRIVGNFWGSDRLPVRPGLKAVELFDAVADGKVRFIWIMATNPVVSMPEADKIKKALTNCDCVVVSDCVADTDTLRLADIRLPAAGWGEKDGTVTNSERCISRQRAFLPLAGDAKPDWWIITAVARRLGLGKQFPYQCAADIFREHALLSGQDNAGGRDFDISGLAMLDNDAYDQLAPTQWPYPVAARAGRARMFEDGRFFTRSGRAQFVDTTPCQAYSSDKRWPLVLNTGRIRDQWHTMTRTGLSARLQQHVPEPFVELHPDDMAKLGIQPQQLVQVRNELGSCTVKARATTAQQTGTAFMPIHWNDCFTTAARPCVLIESRFDAISGQPAFKQTGVAVSPLPCRWHATLISRHRIDLPTHVYWSSRRNADWHITTLAGDCDLDIATLKTQWASPGRTWAEMDDGSGDEIRLLAYDHNKPVIWFASQRETAPDIDEPWLVAAMHATTLNALQLAAGRASGQLASGALVCSCHQVRESTIVDAIVSGCRSVESVGEKTRAGTNCGSCIPEITALLTTSSTTTTLSTKTSTTTATATTENVC